MARSERLELGLVHTDALMDEVLAEMLDHLGVIYVDANRGDFPVVISSTRSREDLSYKNLVVAEDILPMDEVLEVFSGARSVEDRDCFDLRINELEKKLLDYLKNLFHSEGLPLVRKWYWPDFLQACCVLTHDVDWLSYSPFHRVVYRKEPLIKFLKLAFKNLILKKDYGYNIPEIVQFERSKGVKSTFFFQTSYGDVEKAHKARQLVKENGFEIGLHGTRGSHKKPEMLREELDRLRRETCSEIHGVRYHRLKFKPDLTWRLEESVGLKYDVTFSNNKYFGFKSQNCYPFHPIDTSLKRRLKILEMPTVFMDWTALNRRRTREDCQSILNKVMDATTKYNGCFVVNFHNTYLNRETFQEIYDIFDWLIKEALDRRFWVTDAFECFRWWTTRSNVKLEIKVDGLTITGNSSFRGIPIIVDAADEKVISVTTEESFKIGLK